MKYCGKCGAQLPEDAAFCDQCGSKTTRQTFQKEYDIPQANTHRDLNSEEIKSLSNKIVLLLIVTITIAIILLISLMSGSNSSSKPVGSGAPIPAGTYFNPSLKNEIVFNKDGTFNGTIGLDLSFSSDNSTSSGDYITYDNKLFLDAGHTGMMDVYNYYYSKGKLMLWKDSNSGAGMIYYNNEFWTKN